MPFQNIDSPELSQYLSIKWDGPIKPILNMRQKKNEKNKIKLFR